MAEPAAARARRALALALMLVSGFAALGLQIAWTQQAALWLGHEAAGVLAVVAGFFGGLATGALLLAPRVERSARPARWYAACELLVAAWALLLLMLLPAAARWLLGLAGAEPSPARQWAVAFGGIYLLLLPATAAMGATLPAMQRVLTPQVHGLGSNALAALYAGNTAGAVLGVLAAAFWLVPELGLARTVLLCAALETACAAAAWRWLDAGVPPAVGSAASAEAAPSSAAPAAPSSPAAARGLALLLAATGLLGIGYEVVAVRVLSQVAENTVYSFAMLLAAYLAGTALGAAGYQRWLLRHPGHEVLRARLLQALAATCLLGAAGLWFAPAVKAAVVQALGPSLAAALAAEAALATLAFLPATVVMGALFSHLCLQALAAGLGWGRALACNTLGAALAPLVFGVLLLPALGAKAALLLLALAYAALGALRSWRRAAPWTLAATIAALALLAPPLRPLDLPPGGRVVAYDEGALASVSVLEDARGVLRLHINNRQQEGASDTLPADARQALLPLALHPAPRRVLFLGLGTGATAWSAARDAAIEVTAVELLPEVIGAAQHFAPHFPDPAAVARLRVTAADARRYVRAAGTRYDIVVSDNFHPARSGSAALYTVEHFQAVRERLAHEGLFCQWLPLHQLDRDSVRSIVAAFMAVFPQGFALLATHSLDTPVLGLVARRDGQRLGLDALRSGLARQRQHAGGAPPWPGAPADEWALLGSFVAGPRALAALAAGAPLNTDDQPIVAYRAPRITYAPDSSPRERLFALLGELELTPAELLSPAPEAAWAARLAAYWRARDRFLAAGRDVRPSADPARMLAQVREPLLEVLRLSPDFAPAYDPLLRLAQALAASDRAQARALLEALAQAQPARPEAARALAPLRE